MPENQPTRKDDDSDELSTKAPPAPRDDTPDKPSDSGDQKALDPEAALEAGYFGERLDPTPVENYTVAGVTAGKPTPETDTTAAEEARRALRS